MKMKCCICRIGLGLVLACAVGALTAPGCAHNKDSKGTMAAASTKPINTMCVMNPDDQVDPDVTSDYKGQKVGFCCSKCKAKFDKMSDADKDAKLKTAS